MHPSEAATTTCLYGVLRMSPMPHTPSTDVIMPSSTLTPPSSLVSTWFSRKSVIGMEPETYTKTPSTSNSSGSLPLRCTVMLVTPSSSPLIPFSCVLLQCLTLGCA